MQMDKGMCFELGVSILVLEKLLASAACCQKEVRGEREFKLWEMTGCLATLLTCGISLLPLAVRWQLVW